MSYERHADNPISSRRSKDRHDTGSQYSKLETLARQIPSEWVVPVAGGAAGAFAGVLCCPLDVIKTKLQAQGGFQTRRDGTRVAQTAYRGVIGSAATIWKEEGIRGMYRGLAPMLMGYIPTWAVYLTVYNKTQHFFRSKTENRFVANVYASLCGGACSTLVTNPIWVIKTRFMSQSRMRSNTAQSQASWYYRNTWDAAKKIYRTEGFKAFYSGLTPALLGLAHVAIQFPLYEVLKEIFTGIGKGNETDQDRAHHFYGLASAVFLSKVCASTATYPHEVVRTRLQTQRKLNNPPDRAPLTQSLDLNDRGRPPGLRTKIRSALRSYSTWQTCKAIYQEEGWRGFYAGLGTNLVRAVPSAMTTILTFEYLKKSIFYLRQDHQENEGDSLGVI